MAPVLRLKTSLLGASISCCWRSAESHDDSGLELVTQNGFEDDIILHAGELGFSRRQLLDPNLGKLGLENMAPQSEACLGCRDANGVETTGYTVLS